MTVAEEIVEEQLLIRQCLANDSAGWDRLYEHYQPGLLHSIRRRLRGQTHDPNVIEDLAQEVWAWLVAKHMRRLRAFDPEQGRLGSYLDLLAHYRVQQFRQEHARHKPPEALQEWQAPDHGAPAGSEDLTLEEFLRTLSPQEGRFCRERLLGRGGGGEPAQFSCKYAQKLSQRILKRWDAFNSRDRR